MFVCYWIDVWNRCRIVYHWIGETLLLTLVFIVLVSPEERFKRRFEDYDWFIEWLEQEYPHRTVHEWFTTTERVQREYYERYLMCKSIRKQRRRRMR